MKKTQRRKVSESNNSAQKLPSSIPKGLIPRSNGVKRSLGARITLIMTVPKVDESGSALYFWKFSIGISGKELVQTRGRGTGTAVLGRRRTPDGEGRRTEDFLRLRPPQGRKRTADRIAFVRSGRGSSSASRTALT